MEGNSHYSIWYPATTILLFNCLYYDTALCHLGPTHTGNLESDLLAGRKLKTRNWKVMEHWNWFLVLQSVRMLCRSLGAERWEFSSVQHSFEVCTPPGSNSGDLQKYQSRVQYDKSGDESKVGRTISSPTQGVGSHDRGPQCTDMSHTNAYRDTITSSHNLRPDPNTQNPLDQNLVVFGNQEVLKTSHITTSIDILWARDKLGSFLSIFQKMLSLIRLHQSVKVARIEGGFRNSFT